MNKVLDRRKIMIIVIISICIIAIFLAVYIQWFKGKSLEELRKENEEKELNLEEYELLEKNFDSIFINDIKNKENISNKINKIREDEEIIYSEYQGEAEKENEYTISVNIPYINIDSKLAKLYNEDIKENFVNKLKDISKESHNDIYTVEYVANIQNSILHIIIKATLKQEAGAQRIIIKTYSLNLMDGNEVTLPEILKEKNINEKDVQEKIINKIEMEQKEIIELEKMGFQIYKRNPKDEIYEIENIDNFYIDENGYIYIIFAYGNENNTGETDIVII